MKNLKYIISYLLPFIKKYRFSVLTTFILVIVGRVLVISITPLYFKKLIDFVGETTNAGFSDFFPVLIPLFLVWAGGMLVIRINNYVIAYVQAKLVFDMNNESYRIVSAQSYNFFNNSFVGSLTSKIMKFGRSFYGIYDTLLWEISSAISVLLVMFIIVFLENSILGIVFVVWSFLYFFITIQLAKKQARLDLQRSKSESRLSGFISDIFTNIINIKVFSAFKLEDKNFEKNNHQVFKHRLRAWSYNNFTSVVLGSLQLFFQIVVVTFAIYLWSKDQITTGTILLLLLYVTQIMQMLTFLSHGIKRFITGVSDCVEVIEILEMQNVTVDPDEPKKLALEDGNVSLNNVSFTYPQGDHVFEDFNLKIPAGQSVGLVGKSGSGKTTITKLLLRFYDVDQGSVTIDGQQIDRVTQDDLRSCISYIPQESILFHRSVYENIAYGNPQASKEEVIEAAKFAHADEFISKFQDGYETLVGERGVKLSGGQRQRIAIARAMLKKDAPLLVMDEATSSLDSLSERYIQESFEKLMKDRTTIVIAHRLSTVQKMDRIIVLEEGKIVEDGSHKDLIAKNGYYAELWKSQVDGVLVY